MKEIVAVILGGGKGTRLFPLTKDRAKPAVPLAGKYRLIDIPISNCINSEIRQIYVLTMYQSASLNAHVANTYRFDYFSRGFVTIIAAEQTASTGTAWFQGTADAVRKAWVHINDEKSRYILVLSGDHLYRMNYRDFRAVHDGAGADISIAVQPVTRAEAPELGILKTDATGRIVKFVEKPQTDDALNSMMCDTTLFGLTPEQARERPFLASMGIYLFNSSVMNEVLLNDAKQTDFGRDIIPQALEQRHVRAYCFQGYWADIGTVGAFYDANLDLVRAAPRFDFFDQQMPIYTHARPLPGAQLIQGSVENAIVCEGAYVHGATVTRSIIGLRSIIMPGAVIEGSLIMGADAYPQQGAAPRIGIGEGAHIRKAIIDKGASIGPGVKLINKQNLLHYDDPHGQFFVRDGIVIVAKKSVIPEGFEF